MKRVRPQRGPLLELIPDFCRGGALLTQAFILQLVAFVLTLAGDARGGDAVSRLMMLTIYLQWIGLISAILLTLAGKGLGVLAPLVLGAAVNRLAAGQGAATAVGLGFAAFAIGWALVRFLSAASPLISDVVLAPVRAAAQRATAAEAFAHALSLSLDFHQTKRSGALSRTMDRGSRAVDFLLRILAFNLVPTGVELLLAAAVLGGKYDWRFAAVAVAVVAIYTIATFAMSNWRLEHRRIMNAADSEAAGVSVDALLNYATAVGYGTDPAQFARRWPARRRISTPASPCPRRICAPTMVP